MKIPNPGGLGSTSDPGTGRHEPWCAGKRPNTSRDGGLRRVDGGLI